MHWEKDTLARSELDRLQLERLRRLVEGLAERVPFYRDRLSRVKASGSGSLEWLSELPFTTKDTLREHYPFGLLSVPLEEIVRVHASSGTTGKPTVVAYTRSDMALWSEVMARCLEAASVGPGDIVHNAFGYGLFTGGLGFGLGSESIGAATVPASSGQVQRQLLLLQDFGATVLCATPSFALVLAEALEDAGVDPGTALTLRVGLFGAEPWTEAIRAEIESRLGLEAYDLYGLSEIIGPGVAVECSEHRGLHVLEDHFLPEIVDPDTGESVPDGDEGELVLTTLTKEALPLLRYRTRDRARLDREPCACGRTLVRMSRVLGRTDDMIVVRGVNVFPSQIEHALLSVEGLAPHYQIVVDRQKNRLDELEVWVEASAAIGGPAASDARKLQRRAQEALEASLGIRARVRVTGPREIERSQGKAVRVVDRRKAT